jgi:hypothetical protein
MMTGPLAKSGYYGFTNMAGDIVLALPADASFQLNAKVSEKHDIVSDFKLTYLNEPPAPPAAKPRTPPPEVKPKTSAPVAKDKPAEKKPATGPIIVDRSTRVVVPYVLRRVNAVCGSGDAIISVASFGGTIRIKKI